MPRRCSRRKSKKRQTKNEPQRHREHRAKKHRERPRPITKARKTKTRKRNPKSETGAPVILFRISGIAFPFRVFVFRAFVIGLGLALCPLCLCGSLFFGISAARQAIPLPRCARSRASS